MRPSQIMYLTCTFCRRYHVYDTSLIFPLDDISEGYKLIQDLEPTTPQEYILKGVVNAALGQEQGSVSIDRGVLIMLISMIRPTNKHVCF